MFHISPFSDQIVNQCHFLTSDSHPLRQVIFIKSPIYGKLNLALNFAHKVFYPAMTAFTDQYSLPNIFFDIGQL